MKQDVQLEPCFSCGASVPSIDGPTHSYMLSSPGCWAVYGEVLLREYSDRRYSGNHRLTVDAYAVQHPGEPTPQAVRSVRAHLSMLYLVLECGWLHDRATEILGEIASRNKEQDLDWLEPPESLGEVTVLDVRKASSPETHLDQVEQWAHSAWQAWKDHHDAVRSWMGSFS